jgi:hypothetical protein
LKLTEHTSIRSWRWALALIIACTTTLAVAGSDTGTTVQSFPLPEHGSLEMSLPDSWKLSVQRPRQGLPPSIKFSPTKGDAFVLLVTPLWSPHPKPGFNSPTTVRSIVEASGRPFLDRAVETKLVLSEIKGSHAHGYAFSLKDNAPGPGEYEYMTQGAAGVGDLLITFTILTHSRDSIEIRRALNTIRSSKHIP